MNLPPCRAVTDWTTTISGSHSIIIVSAGAATLSAADGYV